MRHDELLAEVQGPTEVEVGDAYQAAEERAVRMTRALILVEAQVLHWKRMYVAAESARADAADRAERLALELAERYADSGPELAHGSD